MITITKYIDIEREVNIEIEDVEVEVGLSDLLKQSNCSFEEAINDVCEHFGVEPSDIVIGSNIEAIALRLEKALKEVLFLAPHARNYIYKAIDEDVIEEAREWLTWKGGED